MTLRFACRKRPLTPHRFAHTIELRFRRWVRRAAKGKPKRRLVRRANCPAWLAMVLRSAMRVVAAFVFMALASTLAAPAYAGGDVDWSPQDYYWPARHHRETAAVMVRPDALRVSFSVSRTDVDPVPLVAQLQTLVGEVQARLAKATGLAVTTRLEQVRLSSPEKPKDHLRTVAVSGEFVLPLAARPDYWSRALTVATVFKEAKALEAEFKDPKKATAVELQDAQAIVLDAEPHRPDILKRWAERVRALAQAAQGGPGAAIRFTCRQPGNEGIRQGVRDLMMVEVSLAVDCSVEVGQLPAK